MRLAAESATRLGTAASMSPTAVAAPRRFWGPSSVPRWWCSVGRSTCGLEAPDYLWPSNLVGVAGAPPVRRAPVRGPGLWATGLCRFFFCSVPTVKLDEALGWITIVPFGVGGVPFRHPLVAAPSRRILLNSNHFQSPKVICQNFMGSNSLGHILWKFPWFFLFQINN
jgi:hypothetical protein